jgi:DNA-directed RNA polymerase subunit L
MTSVSCTWPNTTTYVVNALRRTIMSDMDTVAIPNERRSAAAAGVTIVKNDSALNNEYLMHRVAMLPLNIEPSELAHQRVELELSVHGEKVVHSQHICLRETVPLYPQFDAAPATAGKTVVRECIDLRQVAAALDAETSARATGGSDSGSEGVVGFPTRMLISRLQPTEVLHMRMCPRIGTAREDAAFSCVSKCCFSKLEQAADESDFRFQLGLVHVHADVEAFVRRAFDKLVLRLKRLRRYFEGDLEVDVGRAHPWLQEVVDETQRAVVMVAGKDVYGAQLSAVHGSRFCLRMPDGFADQRPERIVVEMQGGRGELVLSNVEVVRALTVEDHVLSTAPFVLRIDQETHTLGNLLQGCIFDAHVNDPESPCTGASYSKPYPLDDYILLQIDVPGNSVQKNLRFLCDVADAAVARIEDETRKLLGELSQTEGT